MRSHSLQAVQFAEAEIPFMKVSRPETCEVEECSLQSARVIAELGQNLRRVVSCVPDINERYLIVHCALHVLMRDHSDLEATTPAEYRSALARVLRWRAQQARSGR